mmetsp:Transcript_18403/g.43175  ORF Transcript_18403/g.43175 Transcript_18403/m.43175 type:complete len:209 (+) Transcript_18403:34-660(+)
MTCHLSWATAAARALARWRQGGCLRRRTRPSRWFHRSILSHGSEPCGRRRVHPLKEPHRCARQCRIGKDHQILIGRRRRPSQRCSGFFSRPWRPVRTQTARQPSLSGGSWTRRHQCLVRCQPHVPCLFHRSGSIPRPPDGVQSQKATRCGQSQSRPDLRSSDERRFLVPVERNARWMALSGPTLRRCQSVVFVSESILPETIAGLMPP